MVGMRMYSAIGCGSCGQVNGHKLNCPGPEIERLSQLQMHARCPQCGHAAVDRNDDDFMECRSCHTQFRRALEGDDPKSDKAAWLDLRCYSDLTLFFVLEEKGQGKFSIDASLEEARKRHEKFRRRVRK